ncbi:uncharacterized protein LOC143413004 [Maylandia zebra]|uniref:uncharacterized protein LOC143413004 n=1 Tax=Maylandia zebra TaxID=106582 RepID=UPI00403CA976
MTPSQWPGKQSARWRSNRRTRRGRTSRASRVEFNEDPRWHTLCCMGPRGPFSHLSPLEGPRGPFSHHRLHRLVRPPSLQLRLVRPQPLQLRLVRPQPQPLFLLRLRLDQLRPQPVLRLVQLRLLLRLVRPQPLQLRLVQSPSVQLRLLLRSPCCLFLRVLRGLSGLHVLSGR